jgi:isopentenyldiphosphate isomerase
MGEEYLDIYDAQIRPLGTASRREVHDKGYWHKTFHCWLVRRSGDKSFVRFQKRQIGKDTYPGYYDITTAGHLSAGETVREAAREIREELGISASFEELIAVGECREESAGEAGGVPFIDREMSYVYGLSCALPLDAFRLQPEEVSGIYEADMDDMIALFEGRSASLQADGLELLTADGSGLMTPVRPTVQAADFVPRDSGYYASLFRKLRELL